MPHLLLTGASGYIGSHTAYCLLKNTNYHLLIVDDLSTGFKENIAYLQECFGERVSFVQSNINDISKMRPLLLHYQFEAVIHFAASLIVGESVLKPLEYYTNNTLNTTNLIALCVEYGITKFIFSSTAAVYGEPDMALIPIDENAPLLPINPYGASKMMSERVLADTAKAIQNFNYVALRYFNVAGASMENTTEILSQSKGLGQRSKNATHLIKVACECACGKRESMSIFGTDYPTKDGTCIRDYIHIDDLASAHLEALHYLQSTNTSNIFNVGYSKGYSVKEVIDIVKQVSGVDFKVIESARREGDPIELSAKNDKILSLTQWKPQYDDLRLIVKSAYDWECSLK
ncbi:UDP-glucose 4-epimerase GalE [Helicobacter sp. MIT 21-1697]|uniref:UDP-glucose 4-epimerase GalE n=1 Tax=Helicobacter sp. MIT 21-1697 TaxID=2993733 RepID=UPI00224AD6BF|nr:UDP-glucose 4-epimerase GalE [Helicobacter sp. MIT 21-1697]MCX2716451.1 UDP-glucose 4-epimerase GalE [Helicobacter sp. MIT 21-1697]